MIRRALAAALLLMAVAAITWWFGPRQGTPELLTRSDDSGADYYLEQFTATVMGADGTPMRRLRAERMEHYPHDDSTALQQPLVTIFEPQRPPWTVKSEQGWLSGDGELLLLQGTVEIHREKAADTRPVDIYTRDLRVQPEQNYAETDQPIEIRSDNSRVTSVGMQAWFAKPSRIKLLANVRGHYEVN